MRFLFGFFKGKESKCTCNLLLRLDFSFLKAELDFICDLKAKPNLFCDFIKGRVKFFICGLKARVKGPFV